MIDGRKALVIPGIVAIVAAGAACSGSSASSTAAKPLTTRVDHPLSLTPAQVLAATGGATPVAYGAPANGKLTYGRNGVIVYTPNKGFFGEILVVDTTKLPAKTQTSTVSVKVG